MNPAGATSGRKPVSAPSFRWTDGTSFNGLPGDAFGAWLYNS